MHQMSFNELLLNPSVQPEDAKRLSAQAERIWRLFCPDGSGHYMAVWTSELQKIAYQYCARINELRCWLLRYGLTIDLVSRSKNGNCCYKVVTFEGSNYQRLLRRKGLA